MFSNKLFLSFSLTLCLIGGGFLMTSNLAQAQSAGTSVTILPAEDATVEASGLQEEVSTEQGQVLGEKVYKENDSAVNLDRPVREDNQNLTKEQATAEEKIVTNANQKALLLLMILFLLTLSIGLVIYFITDDKYKDKRNRF